MAQFAASRLNGGGATMAKKEALLVGLTSVDPARYLGNSFADGIAGCEQDVDRYAQLLAPLGYAITSLKTPHATADAILNRLKVAAKTLATGDIFVFCFSGHGATVPDRDGDEAARGDEGDGIPGTAGRDTTGARDEALLMFDRPIIDDELGAIWPTFAAGVRVLMISDSCNSGTNFREFPGRPARTASDPNTALNAAPNAAPAATRDFPLGMRTLTDATLKASLIHLGAARDLQRGAGFGVGGALTLALVQVWNGGFFRGNYRTFHTQIAGEMEATGEPQVPTLHALGRAADAFLASRPFDAV